MQKPRLFALLSVVVIFAMLLSACAAGGDGQATQPAGQAETPDMPVTGDEEGGGGVAPPAQQPTAEEFEGEPPPPEAGDRVEVSLSTWAGVREATELQALIDELNEQSDTYWIVQRSSPSEYWTVLQTTLAGGTASDLFWVDQEHLPDLALRGALLDITDRVSSDDHPAAALDDYFEAAIDAYRFEDRLYGLPWIGMPVMLYVNLDYLAEAGYSEEEINDWTWDDFKEACVRMTVDRSGNTADSEGFDPTNIDRYGFSLVPGWPPVQMFIWQAGGDVISDDLTQVPLDSPEAIQGAQFVADLANELNCTPQQSVISERGFGEMMEAGQVAMFMGGAADPFESVEGRNIKSFLLPQGPQNRDTWSYIAGMSINAAADNPDVVYEAFMDLSQAIQEWKVPSPRISLATVEGIAASSPAKEVSAENIIANMEHMRAPVIFPGYAEWVTIFGERFVDPLVRGTSDAETLAQQVRPLLEDQLQRAAEQQR